MISVQEQEKVDQMSNRLEETRRITKGYQKYIVENIQESDQWNKRLSTLTKSFLGQVIVVKEDLISLGPNVSETIQLFDYSAKVSGQQQTECHQFVMNAFDDYFEKLGNQAKKITELNQNNLKQVLNARQGYVKAKSRYEKLCKEIDQSIQSLKKNQNEANSGQDKLIFIFNNSYNISLASKNEIRIKDLIKQIEQAEQSYKDQTEAVSVRTKEFQDGLVESFKQLKQVLKYSDEKLLEITMKQDQHHLLSYNWIKGYIEEKLEKISSFTKFDPAAEDTMIQGRIDAVQQDLVLRQTNIKYCDIMRRLMGEQQGTIQDLEYQMYPDLLQKFIEFQVQVIVDRIKNLKVFANFFSELATCLDGYQKFLGRSVKASLQLVQEKLQGLEPGSLSLLGKKMIMIQETQTQFYESFSKKIYQLIQFIQMKQGSIENLMKDQKTQEKSFNNMYSKMLKDILTIRNQLQGTMFDGENKQTPQQRDQLQNQLKKIIKESAPIIKYSLEQIRTAENQRSQQITTIAEGIVQQYNIFVDENIKAIKSQEEVLNKRYDLIESDNQAVPPIQLPNDVPECAYTRVFEMTEDLQKQIEQVPNVNPVDNDEEDDRNLEDGAGKISAKLLEKFKVGPGETCLASYACAFDNKILLQGRLYVFTGRICFHSYFNAKTLFGQTLLIIPPTDITLIRRSKVYFIDNAIEITTKKGCLQFGSFINRESTFQQMKHVKGLTENNFEDKVSLEQNVLNNEEVKQDQHNERDANSQAEEQSLKSLQTPQKQVLIKEDNITTETSITKQVSQQSPAESKEQLSMIKESSQLKENPQPKEAPKQVNKEAPQQKQIQQQKEVEKKEQKQVPVQQIKEIPLQNLQKEIQKEQIQPELQQGAVQANLYNEIMVQKKSERIMNQANAIKFTIDLNVGVKGFGDCILIDRQFPAEGVNYGSFMEYYQIVCCKDKECTFPTYQPQPSFELQQPSKRTIVFQHPVREKSAFAPPFAGCSALDTLYLFSHNEILMERELSFFKIPYADTFKCRNFYYVKQNANGGCKLEYGYQILFVKSTMFKSIIERSSKSEQNDVWETLLKPLIIKETQAWPQDNIQKQEVLIQREQLPQIQENQVNQSIPSQPLPSIDDQKIALIQKPIAVHVDYVAQDSNLEKKLDTLITLVKALIVVVTFNLLFTLVK